MLWKSIQNVSEELKIRHWNIKSPTSLIINGEVLEELIGPIV